MQEEYNPEAFVEKIRSLDRSVLRGRLESLKAQFIKAEGRRREQELYENSLIHKLRPQNPGKLGEYYFGEKGLEWIGIQGAAYLDLWNESHEFPSDNQTAHISIAERVFKDTLWEIKIKAEYDISAVEKYFSALILLEIIDEKDLWLGDTLSVWIGDLEVEIIGITSFSNFKDMLLEEKLIDSSDLALIDQAANRAVRYLENHMDDQLIATVQRSCFEAFFYAFDETPSRDQYSKMMRMSEPTSALETHDLRRPRAGRRRNRRSHSAILDRYKELHSIAVKIATYYKREEKTYFKRNRSNQVEWPTLWHEKGTRQFPQVPVEMIDNFSDPDEAIPSVIARKQLSREINIGEKYLESLLSRARKLHKQQTRSADQYRKPSL